MSTRELRKTIPVKTGEAALTNGFWAHRTAEYMSIITNMEKALLDEENAARLLNFGIAAGEVKGDFYMNDWSDGDCYKFIEGCVNQYAVTGDKAILGIINKYIPWFEAAQEEDGYICTQTLLTEKERWAAPLNHELYNYGHLFTAACILHEVTGDSRLLDVAVKAADYLWTVFSPLPADLGDFGFNPSQIMGLAELYRATGNEKYLKLADIFVTMRGTKVGTGDQNQNRVSLRKEVKPVGHAVTAAYLYAGAADVYAHTGEAALIESLEKIWDDMVSKRIYITGGVCPLYVGISERGDEVHEAFGDEYDLPHRISYNETCANIAVAMWAYRMLILTGKPEYGDWMEQILFNAGISGASLDMTRYFYANPLAHRAKQHIVPDFFTYSHVPNERFHTFDCWCCPPQLWRTFTGLPKWIWSVADKRVSINLFAGSALNTELPGGEKVHISMTTEYPWEEKIVIRIEEAPSEGMTLDFRIPGWCRSASVNGQPAASGMQSKAVKAGDVLEIILPMKAELYSADPMVEQANGMVCVKRGPVVYCLEGLDIEDGTDIDELALPIDAVFTEETIEDLPYNMTGLKVAMLKRPRGEGLYHPLTRDGERVAVRLIPYFAWANRTESDMNVWFPRG